LHLEDTADDAFLFKQALPGNQVEAEFEQVPTRAAFLDALEQGGFEDVFL